MNPLVSIIVPVYNVKKYLNECIKSLIDQTYKNIEIILIDDGSTDGSSQICDKAKTVDNRIKVIHKINGGLSDARNKGISIAHGEYYAFVDSDDYISNDFIEVLLTTAMRYSCEIAQCLSTHNSNDIGKIIKQEIKPEIYTGYEMIKRIYEDNGVETIVIWSKLYHKKLFENIRFPKGKLHEDEFIDYKLFDLSEKVAIVNRKLYFYRINPDSIVRSTYKLERMAIFEALEERIDYFDSKGYNEMVAYTYGAYVKQLIIHIRLMKKKSDFFEQRRILKTKLKLLFFQVIKYKYLPKKYKIMLFKMRYFGWVKSIKKRKIL